jgi:hypothetical protein
VNGTEFQGQLRTSDKYFAFQSAVHILKVTGKRCFDVRQEHGYINSF